MSALQCYWSAAGCARGARGSVVARESCALIVESGRDRARRSHAESNESNLGGEYRAAWLRLGASALQILRVGKEGEVVHS